MKTLTEVLREGQIEYGTLEKYKRLGLLPRPTLERKGHRGAKSYYPDEIIGLIHHIEILKSKGFSLEAIAELVKQRSILEEEEISILGKVIADPLGTFIKLGEEIERKFPDSDVVHAKAEVKNEGEEKIVVITEVVLTKKPK